MMEQFDRVEPVDGIPGSPDVPLITQKQLNHFTDKLANTSWNGKRGDEERYLSLQIKYLTMALLLYPPRDPDAYERRERTLRTLFNRLSAVRERIRDHAKQVEKLRIREEGQNRFRTVPASPVGLAEVEY